MECVSCTSTAWAGDILVCPLGATEVITFTTAQAQPKNHSSLLFMRNKGQPGRFADEHCLAIVAGAADSSCLTLPRNKLKTCCEAVQRSRPLLLVLREPDRPPSWLLPQSLQSHAPSIPPRPPGSPTQKPSRDLADKRCAFPEILSDRYLFSPLINSHTSPNSRKFVFPPFWSSTWSLKVSGEVRYVFWPNYLCSIHPIKRQQCQFNIAAAKD
jgi:hypothetical protein